MRRFDPLLPAEMARTAERLGAQKTRMDPVSLFALAKAKPEAKKAAIRAAQRCRPDLPHAAEFKPP